MKVSLTFVEWWSPASNSAWCYCAETFSLNDKVESVEAAREKCFGEVRWELANLHKFINLVKRGWIVSEKEIIPPLITEEAAINKVKVMFAKNLRYPENFNGFHCFKKEFEIVLE